MLRFNLWVSNRHFYLFLKDLSFLEAFLFVHLQFISRIYFWKPCTQLVFQMSLNFHILPILFPISSKLLPWFPLWLDRFCHRLKVSCIVFILGCYSLQPLWKCHLLFGLNLLNWPSGDPTMRRFFLFRYGVTMIR